MRAHVAEHLARFKVPRYVWLERERLPRGATEKIDRRALRDRMLREKAAELGLPRRTGKRGQGEISGAPERAPKFSP